MPFARPWRKSSAGRPDVTEIGVTDAARNNAAWCDAVCRAHGKPGEFCDSHWLTWAAAPPYFPNVVTLDSALGPALAAVRALDQARPSATISVKDSFGVLPLERVGFRMLLTAEWIHRPAELGRPRERSLPDRWFRVDSEPALSAWEAAWGESLGQPRVFLPALLARSELAILARLGSGGAIAAGVVANRTENAVGLSNLFGGGEDSLSVRAACIEAATAAFPGLPLVGYEAAQALAESRALGFVSVGPLRVWVKDI